MRTDPHSQATLRACVHSITGRRSGNEDACCSLPDLGLFAVADGMGGYEGGEIASQLAIDTLVEVVRDALTQPEGVRRTWPIGYDPKLTEAENVLNIAIRLAHDRIRARRQGALERMGSTLAVLLVHEGEATIAHIGDSRVYRLREGRLSLLTRDHTLAEEVASRGTPTSGRGLSNILTRALGSDAGARRAGQPELRTEPAQPGDTFLLCSDGLSGALTETQLAAHLTASPPDAACHALVDAAFDAGSHDNITAVVVALGA